MQSRKSNGPTARFIILVLFDLFSFILIYNSLSNKNNLLHVRHFHSARFKVYNPALNLQRLISIHKNISGMDQETGVRNPVCAGIKKHCTSEP